MWAVSVDKTRTFGNDGRFNFIIVAEKGTALIKSSILFCAAAFGWTTYFPERRLALRQEQGGTQQCVYKIVAGR